MKPDRAYKDSTSEVYEFDVYVTHDRDLMEILARHDAISGTFMQFLLSFVPGDRAIHPMDMEYMPGMPRTMNFSSLGRVHQRTVGYEPGYIVVAGKTDDGVSVTATFMYAGNSPDDPYTDGPRVHFDETFVSDLSDDELWDLVLDCPSLVEVPLVAGRLTERQRALVATASLLNN